MKELINIKSILKSILQADTVQYLLYYSTVYDAILCNNNDKPLPWTLNKRQWDQNKYDTQMEALINKMLTVFETHLNWIQKHSKLFIWKPS